MSAAQGRAGSSLFDRLRSGGSSAVGLSIGASSIKIVELKKKKKKWHLLKYASVPVSEITSDQREITHPNVVVQSIEEVVKKAGITSKNVCSAIAGSGLIIKNLMVTVTNMKELQDQVYWEAEQYIPYDISEVVIDYQKVGEPKGDQVEVILVAVKKDFLEQYMSVIEQSKLKPKIMDTELFALQNVFETNYQTQPTESVLLADVGALSTKIVICGNGIPYFTKDATFGGYTVTHEIQRELSLPRMEDAESLKVSSTIPHEVSEILSRSGQSLAIEIKKALDFYSASSLGPPVKRIYLSGGGARILHLTKIVSENTNLPCEMLDPFVEIERNGEDSASDIAPEVVIPLGLAIRAGVDR